MDPNLEGGYLSLEAIGHVILILCVLFFLYYVGRALSLDLMALTICRQLLPFSSTHFPVYQVSYPCLYSPGNANTVTQVHGHPAGQM